MIAIMKFFIEESDLLVKNKYEPNVCKKCGKYIEENDRRDYRPYKCKKCWNAMNLRSLRRSTSKIEGYFALLLRNIKYDSKRNVYDNNIDLQYLMKLYKLQKGMLCNFKH